MIYLGIDPGSICCGYGLIEADKRLIKSISYETIKLKPGDSLAERIVIVHNKIRQVIDEFQPDKVGIESIFYGKNIQSAFTLGHVRGAIVLAAALHKIPITDFSPREIKKGITGNGNASKSQVQYMLPKLLGFKTNTIPEDASDALAVAFCLYSHDKYDRK